MASAATFVAPIAGLISNRALAMPAEGPQGAAILENWFPTATTAILRRGSAVHAQIAQGQPVGSIFKYVSGNNRKLFAASGGRILDITTVANPIWFTIGDGYTIGEDDYEVGNGIDSTAIVWEGASGDDWHVVQFATTGGIYLVGVNGESAGFIYDGVAFYPNIAGGVFVISYDGLTGDFEVGETVTGGTSGATGVVLEVVESDVPGAGALVLTTITGDFESSEALTGSIAGAADSTSEATSLVPGMVFPGALTSADMAFIWVYKRRLWFAQKDSLSGWYLEVDQIGGTVTEFPLGGEFGHGGSLLLGQSWALSASGQGGLSEQNVFLSSEGEVVVYQGDDPDQASEWGKVGTYRIGAPMGRRGFIRAGGDLVFATTIGFVALSTAVQVDYAALAPKAVSFAIEDLWNSSIQSRASSWACCLWPEGQMVAVAPPSGDGESLFLVSNARTGAWAKFTNWDATCMEVFNGRLFFGTPDGMVVEAMVGGTDRGSPFTGTYVPLFSDDGKPTARKAARIARSEILSAAAVTEKLSCRFDFDLQMPAPPNVAPLPVGNEWNNAIWDLSAWGAERASIIGTRRHSVAGSGYRIAPVLQIVSGAPIPLDAQIVAIDVTYEYGDIFT